MDEMNMIQALAKALSPHLGTGIKASGTPSSTAYPYVNGGLFGRCEGDSSLINAMVGPIGVEGALEWMGTDTEREFVDALTDIVESGSEQSTACGDCISVSLRACAQFYCFGRFCRQTEELQFDRIGLRGHAGIPVKALFGNITDPSGNVLVSQGEQITDAFMLQSRAAAYALRLKNATLIWSGASCNNSGSYQEFNGFETIVNTGKYDAYTQLSCDAIDSFLIDLNNQAFTSDGSLAIRKYFARVVQHFAWRASRAGLDWNTAEMFIAMTPNQWHCVSQIYACAGIDLCNVSGQSRMNQSVDEANRRYEEIRQRKALPIEGRWYPVIEDGQITETHGQANGSISDIYFITTAINGEAVTYGQYQNFNQTYGRVRNELTSMFGSDDIAITDNGRFALVRDNSRGCFDVQVYTKPRIVARMPWLLARLQNVACNVTAIPFDDTTGSGRVYERQGGRQTTPVPTVYGDCTDC